MIPLCAILLSLLFLTLSGAGILSWTVAAVAAALAAIDLLLELRRGIRQAPDEKPDAPARWGVDRAYLLALAFLLATLIPLPLAATRWTGSERHAQNSLVAQALTEAADRGLAPLRTDWFAFTRNRAGTMRIAAMLIAAYGVARLASRLSARGRFGLLGGLVTLSAAVGVTGLISLRFIPQGDTLLWFYPIPHVLPGPVACFANRNHFAGMMALFSPPAFVLFIHALRTRRWLQAPLWAFCFLALSAALLTSMSRGGFLAWLTGMAAVPLLFFPARRAIPAIALGAALAALLAWGALASVPTLRARMEMLRDPEDSSVGPRLAAWHDTLAIWRAYPVAGAGANAFRMVYPQHRTSSHSGFRTHPENEYLQLLAEGGGVGVALAALLVAACAVAAVRFARTGEPSRALLAALGGGAAAAAAHALTDFALHSPLYALALAALVGVNMPPIRAALPKPLWLAALNLIAALALLSNEPGVQRMENPGALGATTRAEARQALVWAPTHWRAWTRWGYLNGRRGGEQAARYAECCASRAAQYDPLSYRLWQYLGYVRLGLHDYHGARKAFARMHALRSWVEVPHIPEDKNSPPEH